jgi:hypothetical protein
LLVPASRRRRIPWIPVIAVLLAVVLVGVTAVGFNVAGVGTRFEHLQDRVALFLNPPPDRPIDEEILVTPQPIDPTAAPTMSLAPGQTPPPTPEPTPKPPREPVDVEILKDPDDAFIHQQDHDWCAVAGTQMVLAMHGQAPLTKSYQDELASRIGEWESRRDSRNGGWGPAAMAAALEANGVPGYEVRAYLTRQDALTDAARAIQATGAPVILLTWRGAHTWVMTGFRADADPSVFDNADIEGVYILDPWYPDVSSIWGPSDKPGHFEDMAEMRRNYLAWERPEGSYESRDGKWIAVVPTQPMP